MNIAQALRRKKEIWDRITTLEARIMSDCLKRSDVPCRYSDMDFNTMESELNEKRGELLKLKIAIDEANHIVDNNYDCVYSLMAQRSILSDKLGYYERVKAMEPQTNRYSEPEKCVKIERRCTDAMLDRPIDEMTAHRRRLDDKICELNAKTQVSLK